MNLNRELTDQATVGENKGDGAVEQVVLQCCQSKEMLASSLKERNLSWNIAQFLALALGGVVY